MRQDDLPEEVESIGRRVIGCAIEVHRTLGPGLLERLYEQALVYELHQAGLSVESQVQIRIPYKSIELDPHRVDLIVASRVIVELKAIEQIAAVHKAQLLSYLRLTTLPLGLLINFNEPTLKDGVRRVINKRSPFFLSPSRSSRLRVQPDPNPHT